MIRTLSELIEMAKRYPGSYYEQWLMSLYKHNKKFNSRVSEYVIKSVEASGILSR